MINTSYRYSIEVVFVTGEKYIRIPRESITSLIGNHDYDTKTMPTLYMGFRVNSDLYNAMVEDIETAYIILTIKKYDNRGSNSLKHIYIQKEFKYFMGTDPDYHRPLNKMDNAKITENDSYKKGIIGLLDPSLLDDNKVLYNDIIKNSNMISIVHKYTNHMPMIIEPFDHNKKIDTLIIPPITSITYLLNFLNEFSTFYDKGYRYFRDFDQTYLLSNNGVPVDDGKDEFQTVMINILDTTDPLTKTVGLDIDKDIKAYVMNIDALDTSMNIDIIRNKNYNAIIGITSSGEIKRVNLANSKNNKEKVLLQRISNDNLNYIDNIKHEVDSSSVVLQVSRTELDSSILTPNKEYIIRNYREFQEYNGKFLLSSKKEIFIQQENEFISNTILVFKKVMD